MPTSATAPLWPVPRRCQTPKAPQLSTTNVMASAVVNRTPDCCGTVRSSAGSMERSRTSKGRVIRPRKAFAPRWIQPQPIQSATSERNCREPTGHQSPGQRNDRPLQSGDVRHPTAGDGVGSVAKRERGHAEQDSGWSKPIRQRSAIPGRMPCPCHGENTPPPSHWFSHRSRKRAVRAEFPRVFAQLNATLQCVHAPCGDPNPVNPLHVKTLHSSTAWPWPNTVAAAAKSAQCNPDVRKCHQFDHGAKVVVLMHCGAEKVPLSPSEIRLGAW